MKYYLLSKDREPQKVDISRSEAVNLLKNFYQETDKVLNKLESTAPNSIHLTFNVLHVENN